MEKSAATPQAPAPVLVVGAGPTGMLMSLWLTKYGVPHRIVDKASSTGQTSRAIVMHARTLEFYRMLGIADDMLRLGTKVEKMITRHSGKQHGEILIGDAGKGQSYYPFILSVTQDEHEEVLERKLAECGTRVERSMEVVSMDSSADGDANGNIKVTLRPVDSGKDREEEFLASYVIGCDGAHSVVRHSTDIAMEGGTYENTFFVADVYCHGDMHTQGQLNLCMMKSGFAMIAPLPHKENRARIVSLVPKELEGQDVTFEQCWPPVSKAAPNLKIDSVNWFSCYKVHHRCAASFQAGKRAFLCGDSAHLHSPVGGQGMNTGLGDATNLAWKIATAWHAAARGRTSSQNDLLETYTFERKRFADQLVQSTDRFFQMVISQGVSGWFIRNVVFPYIMPIFAGSGSTKPSAFKTTSQTAIEYSPSILSQTDNTNSTLAGARLPWIENAGGSAGDAADNHRLLDGMGWQAHAFGTVPENISLILKDKEVPVYTFPLSDAAKASGFVENNVYLLRPDGYIGLVLGSDENLEKNLTQYIDRWAVGPVNLG